MNENTSLMSLDAAGNKIVGDMRAIDRQEWWLWSSAISVTILLTISTASFTLPFGSLGVDSSSPFPPDHVVRGLWALVVLFNVYVVYKQAQIHRIRHKLAVELYTPAVMDPLTGLFNRRYMDHQLEKEIARCRRHEIPLTLIAFDLDSFKPVNDHYGHAVGDAVLKTFGERLKKATRGSDVAARCGGDEFLLLLPECKPEQVQYVFNRLNGIQVLTGKSSIPVCYSAGWTTYRPDESIEDFLKRADAHLYANKRQAKASRRTSLSPVVAERT
jgi:diguanylate cyclase (GGDEF)-like protein